VPEFISDVPGLCPPPEPYSYAVRHGDTIFLAGQVALDEQMRVVGTTLGEQGEQIWRNIRAVLERCGAGLGDIVKVTYYLRDIRELPEEIAIRTRLFPDGRFPAVTAIQAGALGLPGLMMEVDVIAAVGSHG
jgi:enamine deaminase RidA (YjgF/YER057c/UK114 family)